MLRAAEEPRLQHCTQPNTVDTPTTTAVKARNGSCSITITTPKPMNINPTISPTSSSARGAAGSQIWPQSRHFLGATA